MTPVERFMELVIASPECWSIQEHVDDIDKWNVFVSYLEPRTQSQYNILRWVYDGHAFWCTISINEYDLYKECYTGTIPNEQLSKMMQNRLLGDPVLVKIMDDMIRISSL